MTAIPLNSNSADKSHSPAEKPRKRAKKRLASILGIGLVAGLIFAPAFVAKSSLSQQILPRLFPDYPGKITTGGASLFWWSPAELSDVVFHDQAGEVLMTVEAIRSEKPLINLLLDQIRIGGFHLQNPRLKVTIQEDGSNLEDAVRLLFAPSEDGESLDYAVHVRGGVIEVHDPTTDRGTFFRSVDADIRVPSDPAEAVTVRGKAQVESPQKSGRAGELDFSVSYRETTTEKGKATEAVSLRLKTGDVRLESLAAVIARWNPDLSLNGVLVSDLAVEWSSAESRQAFELSGNLNATNISLADASLLGSDRIRLEYLTHEGKIEYEAGDLKLSKVNVKSDLLSCTADGRLNLKELWRSAESPKAEPALEEFHFKGDVQIARLARMLPETLKIREGLEVRAGQLLVALDAKRENAEQKLSGRISTSRIEASLDGREIIWDRPLEVELRAKNSTGELIVEELACRSDFLSLRAQGTPDDATLKASCRLDALMAELNRFADLKDWKLAGRIDAGFNLKRLSPDRHRGAASAVVRDFRFENAGDPNSLPWEETQLVLAAGGDLVSPDESPRQFEKISLRIASGNDQLTITQTEPAGWTEGWPKMRFATELRGDLRSWQKRLKPFMSTDDWKISGSVNASANAQFAKKRLQLEQVVADFLDLDFKAPAVAIRETRTHVESSFVWDTETRTLKLPRTTWASPSLSLRADDVIARFPANGDSRTSGKVVFRGGLGELARWFALDEALGTGKQLTGTASGHATLAISGDKADVRWDLLAENTSLIELAVLNPPPGFGFRRVNDRPATRWETTWAEDRIAFSGQGAYHFQRDQLDLASASLNLPWLLISASGSVGDFCGRGEANLAGTMTCNLPILADRFKSRLPASFRVAGNEPRPIMVRGPLWGSAENGRVSKELAAATILPWDRLQIYGIPAGPADFKIGLNRGVTQFGPLDVAFGTGRLKLDSQINWNAPELSWQIKKGPVVENLRLTSEVTDGWLRYALPILGGSTEAEGQFSASLTSDAVVPLNRPQFASGTAMIGIESAQMKPGRLANALLDVTRQVKTLVRGELAGGVLPENASLIRLERQNVDLKFANGRVYHQNLQMVLTGIPISTSGSVGFDESLALTAEIPIQPDWIKKNPLLGRLPGKSLRIPIGGTLSRPQIDARAVLSAFQKSTLDATGRILGDEIQDQLKRLFKR